MAESGPQVGQTIEIAIWLSGTETEEHLTRWKTETVPEALARAEQQDRVVIGPPRFTFKSPGEERVPQVPQHITGPNVRLLLAEALVVGKHRPAVVIERGFVNDLTEADLAKLRKITREAYAKMNPGFPLLLDRQCDQLINIAGPEAAVATLRGVGTKH